MTFLCIKTKTKNTNIKLLRQFLCNQVYLELYQCIAFDNNMLKSLTQNLMWLVAFLKPQCHLQQIKPQKLKYTTFNLQNKNLQKAAFSPSYFFLIKVSRAESSQHHYGQNCVTKCELFISVVKYVQTLGALGSCIPFRLARRL